MKQFFCGLGSNLDNPPKKVIKALDLLKTLKGVFDFKASHLYLTSPIYKIPQPNFINAACSFKSSMSPFEIFYKIQEIEIKLGKKKKAKDQARPIDIDLLHVEGVFLKGPSLVLPHPELLNRLFVLKPLEELSSTLTLPQSESLSDEVNIHSQILMLEQHEDHWVHLYERQKF